MNREQQATPGETSCATKLVNGVLYIDWAHQDGLPFSVDNNTEVNRRLNIIPKPAVFEDGIEAGMLLASYRPDQVTPFSETIQDNNGLLVAADFFSEATLRRVEDDRNLTTNTMLTMAVVGGLAATTLFALDRISQSRRQAQLVQVQSPEEKISRRKFLIGLGALGITALTMPGVVRAIANSRKMDRHEKTVSCQTPDTGSLVITDSAVRTAFMSIKAKNLNWDTVGGGKSPCLVLGSGHFTPDDLRAVQEVLKNPRHYLNEICIRDAVLLFKNNTIKTEDIYNRLTFLYLKACTSTLWGIQGDTMGQHFSQVMNPGTNESFFFDPDLLPESQKTQDIGELATVAQIQVLQSMEEALKR